METEPVDKSHMFWSTDLKNEYGDSTYTVPVPVPRVTYRCTGSTKVTKTTAIAVKQPVTHQCKFVTDHPTAYCECICGIQFNEKESVA